MGFEDRMIRNIDNKRKHGVYAKADHENRIEGIKSSIEQLVPLELGEARNYINSQAIQLEGFSDLYGKQVIDDDTEEASGLKTKFEKSDKATILPNGVTLEEIRHLSEITESYLLRGLNESNWIPHCKAIKTSEYDDYKNGVDMVLEYERANSPAQHIGLGIDVTFSSHLEKKLRQIKKDIEAGSLSTIKYFDSQKSHMRGQLKKVPRAVVGFDINSIKRLAKLRRMKGELPEDDSLRFVTLEQLDMQMGTFANYAKKISSPSAEVLDRTQQFIGLLKRFVIENNHYDPDVVEKNEQVKNFAKTLRFFEDL